VEECCGEGVVQTKQHSHSRTVSVRSAGLSLLVVKLPYAIAVGDLTPSQLPRAKRMGVRTRHLAAHCSLVIALAHTLTSREMNREQRAARCCGPQRQQTAL
jgi:hypothetical protein